MKSFSFYSFMILTLLLASCRRDHKSSGMNNDTSLTGSSKNGDSLVSLSGPGDCANFHRKYCDPNVGESWQYNAQSRSGLLTPETTSKMRCTIYKGMDYRMSVCGENNNKIHFKLFDFRTNELLYDNASENYASVFEFNSTATRQLNVEIKLAPAPASKDASCVGFLIYHKLTEK